MQSEKAVKTSQSILSKEPKTWSLKKRENEYRTGSLKARKEFVKNRELPAMSLPQRSRKKMRQSD